jgi:hypothetical protein
MSKRYIQGVLVNFRDKPLASDSYKKYPCDTPGCTQQIAGFRGQEGWVSAFKVRKARIEQYGAALCNSCREARERELHPISPEEAEKERLYWENRRKRFEAATADDPYGIY